MTINNQKIIDKLILKINEKNISKTKIGEILGGNGERQTLIKRANSFLESGKKGFRTTDLQKVADLLGEPVEYFLFDETENLKIGGRTVQLSPLHKEAILELAEKLKN